MSRHVEIENFGQIQGGIRATDKGEILYSIYLRGKSGEIDSMTGPFYLTPDTFSTLCQKMCVDERDHKVSLVKYPIRRDVAEPGRTLRFGRPLASK